MQSSFNPSPHNFSPLASAMLVIVALVLIAAALLLSSQVHAVLSAPVKDRILYGMLGGIIIFVLLCLSMISIRHAVALAAPSSGTSS